jgi:superfamily I DNA and/or RNA helicase
MVFQFSVKPDQCKAEYLTLIVMSSFTTWFIILAHSSALMIWQRNCEALILLQKKGLQKTNASIGVVATLFGDKEDTMMLEQNNLTDWGESEIQDNGLLGKYNYDFDASQSRAMILGLNKKRPVLIIQGPPGTGKTGLLSYLIDCAVRQGERVLVTAPSNAAVDNMVEKLSGTRLNIVRVGNPARISPSVSSRSLGEVVKKRLEKFTQEFERKKSNLVLKSMVFYFYGSG